MNSMYQVRYNKVSQSLHIKSQGLFESKAFECTRIAIAKNSDDGPYSNVEAAKRSKGIIVCSEAKGIRILNDPFCTLPLYYTDTATHFMASSDPQVLIDYPTHPFDVVGVWETLLLNSPLWNRTPYKDVKFLPAACELSVCTETKLQRYWNFEFEPVSTDFNQKTFFGNFDDLLCQKLALRRS